MRFSRSVALLVVCGLAVVLSSGCDKEKFFGGQGIRASIAMYPTADQSTDPRLGLGYYYYMMSDAEKYEIDIDFVPNWSALDNYYIMLRGDYMHILGQTTFYAGGGGGIMYESAMEFPTRDSGVYFMVEGVAGYVWTIGSEENPIPLDLRFTVQMPFGGDNLSLVLMGTLSYEF